MALDDNDGGIQITDKSKIVVTPLSTTMAALHTDLEDLLQGATFANGDVIYSIDPVRNKNSNDVVVYITWENQ